MSHLDEILAKSSPKETLIEHTSNVLNIWLQLRDRYKEVVNDERFWHDSFYAVTFHDFGKIVSNFQETIRGKRAYNDDERIRHEFFSGMFLFSNNHTYYQKYPESLIAVFSHHKPFNDNGFNDHVLRNTSIRYFIDTKIIDEFVEFSNEKAREYQIATFNFDDNLKYFITNDYKKIAVTYKTKIYDPLGVNGSLTEQNRNTYIKHKALLNIADWTASRGGALERGIFYGQTLLKERIINKLITENKTEIANNFQFRKFQEAGTEYNNVIAIAPTGSGKTEAALLWASKKKEWERIIYLLPTRVTSNAIFNRLRTYFGDSNVQLVHSSARLFIKETIDNNYDQKKYFRDKSFFKNINVCTVDQILTLGFNLGFWEVKTFHMLQAKVVIDEIHLYSPYTLGLIISTIKFLKDHFNTSFYIMTATMPKKLESLLNETLDDVKVVRDTELLESARNYFAVRESKMDVIADEIAREIRSGKKVLLVLNTVDKAIEFYNLLKPVAKESGFDAICYHSRFINKDRSQKEQRIFDMEAKNSGGILVATQVVEVSLDIDFDILFTENAPIDAIIQRAGRVNRKREKENGQVIITRHFEISEKVYDTGNVLEDTFAEFFKTDGQRLSERDLTEMVDKVYSNLDIKGNSNYQEGLKKHLDIQYKYDFIKDLTSDEKVFTRENLNTITVIPDCFYEDLYGVQDKDEFTKHELNVHSSWKSRTQSKEHNGFRFLSGKYDYETGFKIKSERASEFY